MNSGTRHMVGLGLRAAILMLVLAVGSAFVAWRLLPPAIEDIRGRARILAVTEGDLSNQGLQRYAERLDASVASAGRRLDDVEAAVDEPSPWSGRAATGWISTREELTRRFNTATPLDPAAVRPAPPFEFSGTPEDRRRAVRCLALAIYHEAALEPFDGQAAVAQVVLNRVRDPDFPPTVCGVVFQGANLEVLCQFSFTCDGSMHWGEQRALWLKAERVAELAVDGRLVSKVGTATYYHADYVFPRWQHRLTRIGPVGRHIFYRPRGAKGDTASLSRVYAGGEPSIPESRYRRRKEPPEPVDAVAAAEKPAAAPRRAKPKAAPKSPPVVGEGSKAAAAADEGAAVGETSLD